MTISNETKIASKFNIMSILKIKNMSINFIKYFQIYLKNCCSGHISSVGRIRICVENMHYGCLQNSPKNIIHSNSDGQVL
jgi:hypothetical protein